ncbi:MAG: hypothetical protein M0Z82_12105, partial [Actinomycetota bacterium]|nr:hypothetical protein [Actinomycetota bacterium]
MPPNRKRHRAARLVLCAASRTTIEACSGDGRRCFDQAVASEAVAVPAVASEAVGVPAVASEAVGVPAVASEAVGVPAVASEAVAVPAVASEAVGVPDPSRARRVARVHPVHRRDWAPSAVGP